jgi:phage baseplate assembly protein W
VIAVDIDYPLHVDGRGRTAAPGRDDHVRDMIEQLLFTNPGERVNRPDFGSGLLELVFAPNSPELAAALQFSMQAALQRWLGDLIDIEGLTVQSDEGTLRVELRYVIKQTGAGHSDVFERPGLP